MAFVTTKSTIIANRDAVPQVINDGRLERGVLKSSIGSAAITNTDQTGSYFPLVAVPSNALLRSLKLSCTAGMTGLTADIGVYKNTRDSGNVALGTIANTASGQFFASAQNLAAALTKSEVINAAGTNVLAKQEQPLWQAIGLSADPATTFDIAIKLTANNSVPGSVGLQVDYVDGGS